MSPEFHARKTSSGRGSEWNSAKNVFYHFVLDQRQQLLRSAPAMKFPGPSVRPTSFLIIAEILRRSWKEASDVKGWNFSLQSAPKDLRSGNFQVFMRAFFRTANAAADSRLVHFFQQCGCGSGFKAHAFFSRTTYIDICKHMKPQFLLLVPISFTVTLSIKK